MDIDISIIIPIYNAEQWIRRLVDSILSEEKEIKIEIILINDGSKDNSAIICKELVNERKNIKYYEHTNHGVSYTRNKGISLAQGKYIMFPDADDYLEGNMISKMYNTITQTESDLVVCNYVYEDEEGIPIVKRRFVGPLNMERKSAILAAINQNCFGGYSWNKIYKKDIIKKNNLNFDENLSIYEDLIFNLKYLSHCRNVNYMDFYGYHYVSHNSSVMNDNSYRRYYQRIYALDALESVLVDIKVEKQDTVIYLFACVAMEFLKSTLKFSRSETLNRNYCRYVCNSVRRNWGDIMRCKKAKIRQKIILSIFCMINLPLIYSYIKN